MILATNLAKPQKRRKILTDFAAVLHRNTNLDECLTDSVCVSLLCRSTSGGNATRGCWRYLDISRVRVVVFFARRCFCLFSRVGFNDLAGDYYMGRTISAFRLVIMNQATSQVHTHPTTRPQRMTHPLYEIPCTGLRAPIRPRRFYIFCLLLLYQPFLFHPSPLPK